MTMSTSSEHALDAHHDQDHASFCICNQRLVPALIFRPAPFAVLSTAQCTATAAHTNCRGFAVVHRAVINDAVLRVSRLPCLRTIKDASHAQHRCCNFARSATTKPVGPGGTTDRLEP